MSILRESPEALECAHPHCQETVWDMPEADDWETWRYADGWVDALCPEHAAEVNKTSRTYAQAIERQDAVRRAYAAETYRYLNGV